MNKTLYHIKRIWYTGQKEMCTMKKLSLLDVLEGLEDNRRELSV